MSNEIGSRNMRIGRRLTRRTIVMAMILIVGACNGGLGEPSSSSTSEVEANGDPTGAVLLAPYARSGWPAVHADSANDRHVPTSVADGYERAWSSLESAAVLSSPVVGDDGRIFVTTALGPGRRNLHVFDAAGSVLWESERWTGDPDEGVDSCAGLFSPVVDDAGDIYLTDCNQLWAFRSTGEHKWTIDLPVAPARSPYQEPERAVPFNPLSGLMIQPSGNLVGTTVFGQVIVVDRDDGEEHVASYTLPALPGDAVETAFQSATPWAGRDIDPEVVEPALQLQSGGVFPSPHPPAQDANGMVYMVARSDISGGWMVYALRIDRSAESGSVFVVWNQMLGQDITSSPALSDDRSQLYVADRGGTVRSVDTESGVVQWSADIDAAGSAVAVPPTGHVVVATAGGDVVALSGDGSTLWTSGLAGLTGSPYGSVSGLVGPTVRVVGSPLVTDTAVVVNLEVAYALDTGSDPPPLAVPVHGEIAVLSLADGARSGIIATRIGDGNGQVTFSTINGVMVTANSCARSSATAASFGEVAYRVRFDGFTVDDFHCGIDTFRPTTRPAPTS